MKALSIRQPWAELILQGRKSIELRERTTKHRGLLAIHAGKQVEIAFCHKWGLNPDALPKGALVGTVEVDGMVEFDLERWNALRDQHLNPSPIPGKWKGWRLKNPRRLEEPIPCRPLPGLFNVPNEIVKRMRWEDGGDMGGHLSLRTH